MKTSLIYLLGLGMGVVLGVLIAPEPGRVTRRKIRDEADKLIDKAMAKKQIREFEEDGLSDDIIVTEERYAI
jgi:gas vesicle protein